MITTESRVGFFSVGTTKLLVMSVATFGIYPIYWLYRNWKAEAALADEGLSPFWRTFFAPIFVHSLASRVEDRAIALEVPDLSPGLVTAAYVSFMIVTYLPDPYWLLGVLNGAALVPLQSAMGRINAASGLTDVKPARFTGVNIAWIVFSALLWLLIVVGMAMEEVP